jgi:hypothetical protein
MVALAFLPTIKLIKASQLDIEIYQPIWYMPNPHKLAGSYPRLDPARWMNLR